jgi:DNA-binding winged helix-turn-helix (wHTH) protein
VPELKIIDVFVCKLRKKLARATGGEHYIETIWGRGYVLRDTSVATHTEPRQASRLSRRCQTALSSTEAPEKGSPSGDPSAR